MGWSTSREILNTDASTSGKFGVNGSKLTYRYQPLSVTLARSETNLGISTQNVKYYVPHPLRIVIQAMTLLEPDTPSKILNSE
jgi:hypothetical protein